MKVKEAMSGTLPRWLTPILLAVCVYLLQRQVAQNDATALMVRENTTAIALLNAGQKSAAESLRSVQESQRVATESLDKLKEITRILETRLVRLETKEENRRP